VAPALIALGAHVTAVGPTATRTLPLDSFFVLPETDPERETVLGRGEVLTGVELPPPLPGLISSYRKVRMRAAWDFALASVAVALRFARGTVKDPRVVLGGVAPVPWRSRDAEAALAGATLDTQTIARAAAAALAKAEPLAGNAYKVPLVRGLLEAQLAAVVRNSDARTS
jgi:xanthine dehydrogenase YagS FAD-binding subunit